MQFMPFVFTACKFDFLMCTYYKQERFELNRSKPPLKPRLVRGPSQRSRHASPSALAVSLKLLCIHRRASAKYQPCQPGNSLDSERPQGRVKVSRPKLSAKSKYLD